MTNISNVVRDINFYLNSRERDPPSTEQRPASISVWTLDVPIALQNPENYFQISVRGFYAEPNLVISYTDSPDLPGRERNFMRIYPSPYNVLFDIIYFLPTGNYTPIQLTAWFNGITGGNLVMSQNVYEKCAINNTTGVTFHIDFSVNLYKAFGFGRSMYGYTQASSDMSSPPDSESTGVTVNASSTLTSPFPLSTARDRTLFVLYNNGTVDNYSITTNESRTYPGGGPTGIENSSWVFGRSGQYRDRRCIAAISLLSGFAGNPGDKIDFTAQNLFYSRLSEPVIHSISLALATECFQIVPIENADYTIVLAVQECTPILQSQAGIPQPIVIPKKGDEKGEEKEDRDNEEYIRQLAQQIKKRRLEKAADRVDQSGALAE